MICLANKTAADAPLCIQIHVQYAGRQVRWKPRPLSPGQKST